jgi:hypothetical protein
MIDEQSSALHANSRCPFGALTIVERCVTPQSALGELKMLVNNACNLHIN